MFLPCGPPASCLGLLPCYRVYPSSFTLFGCPHLGHPLLFQVQSFATTTDNTTASFHTVHQKGNTYSSTSLPSCRDGSRAIEFFSAIVHFHASLSDGPTLLSSPFSDLLSHVFDPPVPLVDVCPAPVSIGRPQVTLGHVSHLISKFRKPSLPLSS